MPFQTIDDDFELPENVDLTPSNGSASPIEKPVPKPVEKKRSSLPGAVRTKPQKLAQSSRPVNAPAPNEGALHVPPMAGVRCDSCGAPVTSSAPNCPYCKQVSVIMIRGTRLLELVELYVEAENYADADSVAKDVLKEHPKCSACWAVRGLSETLIDEPAKAIKCFGFAAKFSVPGSFPLNDKAREVAADHFLANAGKVEAEIDEINVTRFDSKFEEWPQPLLREGADRVLKQVLAAEQICPTRPAISRLKKKFAGVATASKVRTEARQKEIRRSHQEADAVWSAAPLLFIVGGGIGSIFIGVLAQDAGVALAGMVICGVLGGIFSWSGRAAVRSSKSDTQCPKCKKLYAAEWSGTQQQAVLVNRRRKLEFTNRDNIGAKTGTSEAEYDSQEVEQQNIYLHKCRFCGHQWGRR